MKSLNHLHAVCLSPEKKQTVTNLNLFSYCVQKFRFRDVRLSESVYVSGQTCLNHQTLMTLIVT